MTGHKVHDGFPPDDGRDQHERRVRTAFGCGLILAAGWSVLLAVFVLAATRWLWFSA